MNIYVIYLQIRIKNICIHEIIVDKGEFIDEDEETETKTDISQHVDKEINEISPVCEFIDEEEEISQNIISIPQKISHSPDYQCDFIDEDRNYNNVNLEFINTCRLNYPNLYAFLVKDDGFLKR